MRKREEWREGREALRNLRWQSKRRESKVISSRMRRQKRKRGRVKSRLIFTGIISHLDAVSSRRTSGGERGCSSREEEEAFFKRAECVLLVWEIPSA